MTVANKTAFRYSLCQIQLSTIPSVLASCTNNRNSRYWRFQRDLINCNVVPSIELSVQHLTEDTPIAFLGGLLSWRSIRLHWTRRNEIGSEIELNFSTDQLSIACLCAISSASQVAESITRVTFAPRRGRRRTVLRSAAFNLAENDDTVMYRRPGVFREELYEASSLALTSNVTRN